MVYASNFIYQMILTKKKKTHICLYFVKLSYKERKTKPKILDVAFCWIFQVLGVMLVFVNDMKRCD